MPYLAAAQAQKHVTHNEALRSLDALVQISVRDRNLATPPAAPLDGDRYLVAANGADDWSGKDEEIAAFQDNAWMFYAPREGWLAWVADEDKLLVFDGAAWSEVSGSGGGSVNPAALVGVNATADATDRLSVSSPNTLFSHEGSDHRLKINKASAGDTASSLYQNGFSGRAEMGLAGDDDFHFKVSPDGPSWKEAILIDKDTGNVTFPNTSLGGVGGGVNPSMLINGDFQINQRVFAGGALAAGAYGHDRWKAAAGGSDYTVGNYDVLLSSGALEQVVEPLLWGYEDLASTAVTISLENPTADLSVAFGSASGTITAGSGRRSVSLVTDAGDSGNLSLKLGLVAAASTFGRVKLELGAAATGWQALARDQELGLCQRYYQKSYPYNTAPGTSIYAGSSSIMAVSVNKTQPFNWHREMRAAPSFLFWAPQSGPASRLTRFSTASNSGIPIATSPSTTGLAYFFLASGFVANEIYIVHWTAEAEL